ncbi:type VI immunity family protein [Tateyamaria sp. SN6-1]|uniref:type VI immunity family protein n=1 Tax=Tateyamaria sp. SN6-1 TaxID=3092148 RepID=UPI0039F44FBB
MPDYIRSGDAALAQPCFRILAYFPDGLWDRAANAGLADILDIFVARYRGDVAFMAMADRKRPLEGKVVDDELLKEARDWLTGGDHGWPATLRVFGPVSDVNHQITVPFFRVEEHADYGLLDISLPDDPEIAVQVADQVTALLKTMPTLYAIMGMGFFLPLSMEGSETFFPRGFTRYKTCIEFMGEGPEWCIHKDIGSSFWEDFPEATDGFVDIGWRTMLGSYYLPRLGTVDIETDGVQVEQSDDMLIVTAGPAPIWGDVNADEDITAYRAVSEALAPARASLRPMLNGLFGAQIDDPEGTDRVEAWYERFEE